MKYRKKPVVVSAEQFFPEREPWPLGVEWMQTTFGPFGIRTLEGLMKVSPGDWIITGIKGEKYPCRDDIFKATYEVEHRLPDVGRLPDGSEMRAGEEWVAVNKKRLDDLEARVSNLKHVAELDNRQARRDIVQAIRAQAFREAAELCERRAFDLRSQSTSGSRRQAKANQCDELARALLAKAEAPDDES